jgi:hypothetical protein
MPRLANALVPIKPSGQNDDQWMYRLQKKVHISPNVCPRSQNYNIGLAQWSVKGLRKLSAGVHKLLRGTELQFGRLF